jgi:4,5:9,10-diseco-3-hydroxy-5,9,17-trioxoandrosta-1(10),2-diene-4-oate hydrolase
METTAATTASSLPALRAALGARTPERHVVVDGVRLAFDDEGSGPVLLCLHAIGHGARDFERLRARFRSRCRVIALDWPGQGRSGADSRPASAARYAELLRGFVDALGLGDVVVLGNSIGGAAAIRFAAERPGQTRGLVLVDSGGLDRVDPLARLFTRAMTAFFAAGARGARWFPWAYRRYYALVLPGRAAREQRERIVACAGEVAPILVEAWRSFGEPAADTRALAASLRCPVFVAWAKQDRVIQLGRNRRAIGAIPGVRFETFPGGHAPFLECPEAFEASLEGFLDEAGLRERAKESA